MDFLSFLFFTKLDAPPSSLMDSIVNLKVKTVEREIVTAHSLARSILRVKGRARASK